MKTFRNFILLAFRRPFIVIFPAVITLILSLINTKNPLSSLLFGMGSVSGGNIFDTTISLLKIFFKMITNIRMLPGVIIIFAASILLLSLLTAVFTSGYFYIFVNALMKKNRSRGEFITGVSKYFVRMFLISLRVISIGALFLIFIIIASVPAVVITRTLIAGKYELVFVALILDLITAGVLFFAFMTFRIYAFYWYPAALNYERKSFAAAKHLTDINFWNIMRQFAIFDFIFIVFQVLFIYVNHTFAAAENSSLFLTVAVFLANWLFKTAFFCWYITYIFTSFGVFKSNKQGLSQ